MLFKKLSFLFLLLFCILTCSNFYINQIHADALSLAEDYVSHTWTPKSKNINHTLYTEIGRSSVFTAGTEVTGVAYAWGGYDTISGFDTRISNGEPAGLIYSKNSNDVALTWETYHKFAGIDCSGFVSRLWSLTTHRSTKELLNYADRIPFWDANQNDIWDKSTHVMWISTATVSGNNVSFNGYHSSAKGYVNAFEHNLSYFSSNNYQLYRKGNDPNKPTVEITNSGSEIEISKRSSKTLKYKVSDVYCGEAVIRLLIPDLTAKALNDRSKYYQYPREDLCIEGIKLDKKSDTLYERELEINGTQLATFFSISSTKERYCDGKYEIIFKTRDLNPTVYNSATGTIKFPGDNDFDETKQTIILNNYKPEVHKCVIESKGTSGDPAKIDDLVSIKVDFTEEIKEGSTPKIEIEVAPGQFKTLSLEATTWNDNTIDGVKIKRSSFKAQAKMPQHQQSPSSQLEKKLRISGVSGLGTDDQMEPATVTVNGEDIKISADLDYPQFTDGSVVPAETNADEPQQVHVGVKLEDNESGFTPGEHVSINVEGVGTVSGQVDTNGTIQAKFQSPVKEGTYPITVEMPKDKAGNESKEKKKTLKKPLKVTKKPDSDKHANPDESLDLFSPTLTGNKAPRFGPTKVAIFKSGYAVELSDMLATFGEAADYILPENFSPALVSTYPILLIPSAGLANQTNNAGLREKLTEYVENGGNLIIMTQPTDECYQLLPDKVESLGYFQDKACYWSTAGIRKYTPALAGQSDDRLDGTADGVIISWPENAETWLYRLKNNFPALIAYQCGQGRVVVSNYYSDYAHGHSQLNRDEKALIRDLLSWGRDFGEVPEVKPGESLQIAVPAHYAVGGMEASVAQVRLILRNPDRKIFGTQEIPLEITAGETENVSFDFNDVDQSLSKNSLGIWWLNYELLDMNGNVVQAEREGQRVALSKELKGTTQKNFAVTVDAPVTTALEGTKIPFKVITRNDGDSTQNLTLKVYAVLYTLVSQVQEETQVYSENISISSHSQTDITIELLPFKAYTSTGGYSWDKNWWRFVFTDENGKEIITESRGISVYRPAVKANYKLRNLTNPGAAVFKPGDQVCLDLTIENMVPVGYPVDWEIRVKTKNQNRVVWEETGNATLDPVITPYQVFTIPEDLQSDTYIVELAVKHNGSEIPLVFGESNISNWEISNLVINNYGITFDGLSLDLTNPNDTYTDYTILIRVYDESRELVLQDYQSGGINGNSTLKIKAPYSGFAPCSRYRIEGFYLTYPTTHGNWFYHTVEPGQGKLQLTINSVEQEIDSKKLRYHFEIENSGLESSGVRLRTFIKGINYSQKVSVPNLKTGEKTELTIEIPLPNGLEQGVYPVEFAFCYANDSEVLAYRHYPDIKLRNLKVASNGFVCNLANEGLLNADYKFVYKIYKSNLVVGEGELSGLLAASETKQHTITVSQYNPLKRYLVTGKLFYPSSGKEEYVYQWTEPLKVEFNAPKEQTVTGAKLNYDISLTNTGPEFSNLQLAMTLSHPALQRDFVIPPLAIGGTCEFKGELELPGELTPGTYNVNYYLANANGEKFPLRSGSYTIMAPQIAVNPPAKSEFIPGESYGISIVNNGDFTVKVGYELQIYYGDQIVATKNGSIDLGPNLESNFALPIEDNWISSKYCLNWKLTTSPIRTKITGYKAFNVKGMETGLAVATDQSIYRPKQDVIALARLTNGNYPVNGNLELSVGKLTASGGGERIDGWPCIGGNNQRTGLIKLSGKLNNPRKIWNSASIEYYRVGEMDGDGCNEIIGVFYDYYSGEENNLQILDASTGRCKHMVFFNTFYPSNSVDTFVRAALLCDVDNDDLQEYVLCLDRRFIVVLNGHAEILWSKEFDYEVLTSEYMTAADINGDGYAELLLDNLVLNARTGAIIQADGQLGTVGDVNGDGKLEIVTKEAVLDSNFTPLALRNGGFTGENYPILADLDQDGNLEIVMYSTYGICVYSKNYELLWSSSIPNIKKVVCGDVNKDEFQEVIVCAIRPGYCFSYQGVILWNNDFEGCRDILLNDINGDGELDIVATNYGCLQFYKAETGELFNTLNIDYYSGEVFNDFIIADVDGDREVEILGSGFCIDEDRKAVPEIILSDLKLEVTRGKLYGWDEEYYDLGNSFIKTTNERLFFVGNRSVYYYIPAENRSGLIAIPADGEILKETETGIEVWGEFYTRLLGKIDPETLRFTEVSDSGGDNYNYQEPLKKYQIRDGYYYFVDYKYYNDIRSELFVQDLSSGEVRPIGTVNGEITIEGVLDKELLVKKGNQLYRLSLPDLTLTQIGFYKQFSGSVRVNSSTLLLNECLGIYKYDPTNNLVQEILSIDQILQRLGLSHDCHGNLYLISKDENSVYFIINWYEVPYLFSYDLASDNLNKVAVLTEYGEISALAKSENKIYFVCNNRVDKVYCFDLTTTIISYYSFPQEMLELTKNLDSNYPKIVISPNQQVFIAYPKVEDIYDYAICFSLNPVSGQWQWFDWNDLSISDFAFCNSAENIYAITSDELISLNLLSQTVTVFDQSDCVEIVYDPKKSRLFYQKSRKLCFWDLQTQTSHEVADLYNDFFISPWSYVGAYDDKMFFFAYPFMGALWQYSLDDRTVSPVSFSESYIENFYLSGRRCFNPAEGKLYHFNLEDYNIYAFDTVPIIQPPSNNEIFVQTNTVYREKVVSVQTLPINLTSDESKQLDHTFNPFAEPGSYTLRGRLFNSLDQLIASNQCQFVVSDNGLGLSATGDKRYYRPNENITLNGLLFNSTDIGSGPLKFTVTRSINGQTTVVRDEEIILNPGEQRPYALNLYETVAGEYLFMVKLTQNGAVVAEAKSLVTVAEPQVEVEFDLPQAVGSKPVSAFVKLTNKSPYPVSIYALSELLGLAEPIALGANETTLFTKEFTLTNDALLLFNITGDVTANYQRTIIFNEKADLTIDLATQMPESTQNIVYNLSNNGSVAAEFPVGLTLYRNGAEVAQYNTIANLNPNQSLTGEWPVDLTPGDYRLVYSTLNQTKEFNFTCLPDYAATMTAIPELTGLDELKIKINASNTGCNPILGVIKLESEFIEQSIPVEILSGSGYSNVITLVDLPVVAGTYELKITLEAMGMTLATQTLGFTREETVPPAPEMVLADIPVNLTGGAGQEMPVTVKIRNNGDAAGDCIVELNSEAITFGDATVINLLPGAEAEHTFKMIIPDELESGTYQGRIIINESVTHFQYQVNGYKLEAVASLDKAAYLKGETATLAIAVQNKGGQSNIPLTVRVKQGDFDETREITLGTSTTLTYQIPVDDFNQKIFYGFYHSGTGRSLLLDIQNIYEATPEFTAVPDKQRYRAGEVVNFNVQVNREGWLAVAGPNDFYRFEQVDGSRSYAIPLPGDLRTGTYSVWAVFTGKTLEYKIDVIGHDIRYASGKLDRTVYQNEEPFQLDTVVTSGESLNCTALIELVKPDDSTQLIATREAQLAAGENSLNFKGTIKSDQTGTHRIRVRFQAGDLTLSQNDYSFLFGKEELLGITCSEVEYFNGTEPVSGEIHLYGQGNGSVTLYLDGQMVTTLAAALNGNTVIPYQISPSNLKPGHHVLSAVYQGIDGKSGTVTTEFDYGTGLPDLTVSNINVSKKRANDGAIPIAVTVQKGNALPAKEIKVEVTLSNELIGEYLIPELNGEDATDTRTVLWQAGEFNGDAELKVTVNYDNRVREYNGANNTATAKVAIPMVPQVGGLPELANDPRLPIIGQSTPGALIYLYDGRGMIDFGYADASGNFNLTDHYLNQGENRLRLKARNREGWESVFSEEYTVILDAAPPQIIINNLEDNRHYNYDVLPEITIEETDPAKIEYALNGQAWLPGTAISAEGAYQLWVMVTDIAGNRTERLINFTIDKTPPEIVVAGAVDGCYYNTPQSPSVSVNDLNPVTTELTLNGEPYQGAMIEEDGDYLFEVLAYDQAGNTVTRQIGFAIDRTAPVIQISGVSDGETYREAVTPVIEVTEANPEEVTMLINGQPFLSGTAIIIDGSYELAVTAVDKAGNQEVNKAKFTIDQKSGGNYTVFCDSLFIWRDLKADQVFCNKLFYYLKGKVNLEYLGITANYFPYKQWMKIEELETGLERQPIPKPDWTKLSKATGQLWPPKLVPGKTYSNVWVNGNLHLSGKPNLNGILVVNGNLTIARNTELEDLAIFCRGKVTVTGKSQMSGLLYAGREVKINGTFKLTGGIITDTLTIKGDTEFIGGDIGKYEEWFLEPVKKRKKPWWCYWWWFYSW